jgi:hypothetical protein
MKLGAQGFAIVRLPDGNALIGFGAIQLVAFGDRLLQELRKHHLGRHWCSSDSLTEWRDARTVFARLGPTLMTIFVVPNCEGALSFGQPCKLFGNTHGTLFERIQLGAPIAHQGLSSGNLLGNCGLFCLLLL